MSKKGEERLKKKNEKLLKSQSSNARLANSIEILTRPIRTTDIPKISNWPRSGVDKSAYKDFAFHWDFVYADKEGSWTWGEERAWSDKEYSDIIDYHFESLKNNSWLQVEDMKYNGKGGYRRLCNKYQHINTLCDEAQERWQEHEIMSQFERPFRMRLGTDKRIWGVRILHCFFMLWYERNHEICKIK